MHSIFSSIKKILILLIIITCYSCSSDDIEATVVITGADKELTCFDNGSQTNEIKVVVTITGEIPSDAKKIKIKLYERDDHSAALGERTDWWKQDDYMGEVTLDKVSKKTTLTIQAVCGPCKDAECKFTLKIKEAKDASGNVIGIGKGSFSEPDSNETGKFELYAYIEVFDDANEVVGKEIGKKQQDVTCACGTGGGDGGTQAAGVPENEITISTVNGPAHKECGGFDWKCTFTLKNASPAGGWFVQKVIYVKDIKTCANAVDQDVKKTYWEAWEVKPGKKIDHERDQGRFNYDDNYAQRNHPDRKGLVEITGELKFYEGLALPTASANDFKANNPATFAASLPATTTEPAFWSKGKHLSHNLSSTWNCCVNPKQKDIFLTPSVGGRIDMEQPNTSQFGDIEELIASLAPWTEAYGDQETQMLLAASNQLKQVPTQNLRTAVVNYEQVYRNTEVYQEELSKVFLLLRTLFMLPSNLDRSQAKVFGGWIHPSILNTGSDYDLSWPVLYETNNAVIVAPYEGYLGRAYDAVGEFDYFATNFERRP